MLSDSHAMTAETIGNTNLAGREDLIRQSSYFSELHLTRHLLDVMPGIVLVLNDHRQIVFANRSFCRLTGRDDPESLLGSLVGDVLSCHVAKEAVPGCGSGESCKTCGALLAMLSGLTGEESVQECTLTRRCDDTVENLTLRVWSAPLSFEEDSFAVLAGMDISHERRRLALERTFFHDILNLVGSIRGFAELLDEGDVIDQAEVRRRIQLASQRVVEEIDAQRVLLAVEKGELSLDNRGLASRGALDDILRLYEGQDVARKRRLRIDKAAVATTFVGDPTLLRRILGNMVKNALEASSPDDVVTLGVDAVDENLVFWVHNDSVIPDAYQQRIFQRDFSTKGAGRGLGTYSMKLLAHLMSGDVAFTSRANYGTRFMVSLPLTTWSGAR